MSNNQQHEEYTILTTGSNNRGQMSQPHLTFTPPTQVFRSEWQRFPEFHAWLRPIDGDVTKAWCIACERMFRADLKSLRVHGVSKAHVRMVRARCPNADDNPIPPIEYNVVTDKKGTYGIAVVTNKEDKSSLGSRALYMNQTNPTEEIITSEMAAQSQRDKYVVVSLPNEDDDDNEGPQASSSNTQYIQKEVNVIDETGNLVSVVTEHHVQKNKGRINKILNRKQDSQVESEIKSNIAEAQKQSADEDDIAIEEVLTPLRIKQESAANRAHMMKRKRGLQKYRTDWEKLSEFKGWLSPEPKSCYKARCEACDKSLVADITVLRNHSQAKKHVMKTGGTVYEGPIVRSKSKPKTDDDDDEDSPDDLQMKSLSIKDNDDDYEVGLQSNDYHSTSNYEKMDQKHDEIQCKAIVSKPAPFWKATAVVNGHVTELKLSDYSGRYLVLFFYPQDFSRICPSELIALSDRVSEFRALNTEVVACSVDSYLSHQAWSRTLRSDGGIAIPKMPLLSDPTHVISKSYGCYLSELGHSLRAHYIIDMRGILRHVTINDLPVGRNISEILRLLEAFQYTDETETLCPADWKPGEPTIS